MQAIVHNRDPYKQPFQILVKRWQELGGRLLGYNVTTGAVNPPGAIGGLKGFQTLLATAIYEFFAEGGV